MSQEHSGDQEVSFTMDGRPATARPGETVLSVAKRLGIAIPTLCHHDALTPYGACRLCVVEVFWGKRSKLVTSCIYIPYENDAVVTDNERVRRTRRLVLELLSARCPTVKVIRDMAREYGVETPRFAGEGTPSRERCILCGLCARVCAEVVGCHAISYASRGMDRIVTTPFDDQSPECIACGACVFICPTGALHYEDVDGNRVFKELNTSVPMRLCRACGRPFAPEKLIARVQECLNMPEEMAATCASCRTGHVTDVVEQALGKSAKDGWAAAREGAVPSASGLPMGAFGKARN